MGVQTFKIRKEINVEYTGSKYHSIVAGLLATGANPFFFLWWATIGTALIMNAYLFGFAGLLIFAATYWLCDLLWDSFVSFTVFKSRRFWNKRVYNLVFVFCFVVLITFGTWFVISALI